MNSFLKWILAAAGVAVVLFVIAAVVLPMVVDPNNYKDEISAAVLKETGRELTIGGDINWSVFPGLGLGVSELTLTEPGGSGDDPMVDIGEAQVSVKLLPLFRKQVEIGRVDLKDVSVSLNKVAGQDAGTVSGILISDANISIVPASQSAVPGTNTANIELAQAYNLDGDFSVFVADPELAGDVKFSGLIQPAKNAKHVWLEGLDMSFSGKQGPGEQLVPLEATFSANADIDLAKDSVGLNDFVLTLYDMALRGDVDVTSVSTEPEAHGQIKLAEFNPKSLMRKLNMEPPGTTNPDALTSLQGETRFTYASDSIDLQELLVRFDDTELAGYFKLADFDLPSVSFDFQIDQLNLDDYAETGQSDGGPGSEESDLGVDTFRGLAGGGDFTIGTLVYSGMTATDVKITMTSDRTGVRLHPVNADFYGGKHEGDIRIDAQGSNPLLKANLGLSGVQAGDLLKDLAGEARLLGRADFFLQVESDITNSRSTFETLTGDMGMHVIDGSIFGIDVSKTLNLVSSALGQKKEVSGETQADEKTEFAALSMSGVFVNGILNSDDLIMQSPLLNATGKGSFNLVNETVDYVLSPVLTDDSGVQALDKLSGVAIPIRLTGNIYEPDYKVDVVAAVAASQKDVIDEKANELIGKLLGGKKDKKKNKEDQQ